MAKNQPKGRNNKAHNPQNRQEDRLEQALQNWTATQQQILERQQRLEERQQRLEEIVAQLAYPRAGENDVVFVRALQRSRGESA